jgi:hypothetical protein
MLITLAVIVGLASPRLASSLASRQRWNRATSVPELAEAAWDELRLGLRDLGVRWAASWTPRAVERRLLDDYEFDPERRAALGRLTDEIENGRYARPDDELGRTASERMDDVSMVVTAVSERLSGKTQWRARLWPESGLTTLAGLGTWFGSVADRAGGRASALGSRIRNTVGKNGDVHDGDGANPIGEREKVGSGRS